MTTSDHIVYGTVTGPTFHAPVRAMVRYRTDGRRLWKSVTAQRWVTLPPTAVFVPDVKQPQDAEAMGHAGAGAGGAPEKGDERCRFYERA